MLEFEKFENGFELYKYELDEENMVDLKFEANYGKQYFHMKPISITASHTNVIIFFKLLAEDDNLQLELEQKMMEVFIEAFSKKDVAKPDKPTGDKQPTAPEDSEDEQSDLDTTKSAEQPPIEKAEKEQGKQVEPKK